MVIVASQVGTFLDQTPLKKEFDVFFSGCAIHVSDKAGSVLLCEIVKKLLGDLPKSSGHLA